MDTENAAAMTRSLGKNNIYSGNSNVYFSKRAFSSAKELFYNMTHELNHVSQHALLKGLHSLNFNNELFGHVKEFTAYSHSSSLGSSNAGGYGPTGEYFNQVRSIKQHAWYSKFQHSNYAWTKTAKFSNINF